MFTGTDQATLREKRTGIPNYIQSKQLGHHVQCNV